MGQKLVYLGDEVGTDLERDVIYDRIDPVDVDTVRLENTETYKDVIITRGEFRAHKEMGLIETVA